VSEDWTTVAVGEHEFQVGDPDVADWCIVKHAGHEYGLVRELPDPKDEAIVSARIESIGSADLGRPRGAVLLDVHAAWLVALAAKRSGG